MSWPDSMYWSTISHVTVGFGDMGVASRTSRLVMILHLTLSFLLALLSSAALLGGSLDVAAADEEMFEGLTLTQAVQKRRELAHAEAARDDSTADTALVFLTWSLALLNMGGGILRGMLPDVIARAIDSMEEAFHNVGLRPSWLFCLIGQIVGWLSAVKILYRRILLGEKDGDDLVLLSWLFLALSFFMGISAYNEVYYVAEQGGDVAGTDGTLYKGVPMISGVMMLCGNALMFYLYYAHEDLFVSDISILGILMVVSFHINGIWLFAFIFWTYRSHFAGPNDPSIYSNGTMKDFIDAIYFAVISYTTVRFGDFKPIDRAGKALTNAEALFAHFLIVGGLYYIVPESADV